MPSRSLSFLAAVCLDAALGDPPTPAHPVAWFGRLIGMLEDCAPSASRRRRVYGIAVAGALPALLAVVAASLTRSRSASRWIIDVVALDMAFALRTLLARTDEVRAALDAGDLEGARARLAMHLVSRDTADLTASEVAGAAIESVAENLSDAVVAPWLAYCVAGAPGALAYRAINTLDAMWGYRTPPYAELGFGAARLDDYANLVPARLTAAAICAGAATAGGSASGALEAWRRDGGATESPNAGHPMAAMAGAIGVTLTKRGAYHLGAGREPAPADVARAIVIARHAAVIVGAAMLFVLLMVEDRS